MLLLRSLVLCSHCFCFNIEMMFAALSCLWNMLLNAQSPKAIVSTKDALLEQSPPCLKKALKLASEGYIITCTRFDFIKQLSWCIVLQYGWDPIRLPNNCPGGIKFSKVGSQLSDIIKFVFLLTKVCPTLQSITGESFYHAILNKEDGACLDVSMCGFWGGRCEKS